MSTVNPSASQSPGQQPPVPPVTGKKRGLEKFWAVLFEIIALCILVFFASIAAAAVYFYFYPYAPASATVATTQPTAVTSAKTTVPADTPKGVIMVSDAVALYTGGANAAQSEAHIMVPGSEAANRLVDVNDALLLFKTGETVAKASTQPTRTTVPANIHRVIPATIPSSQPSEIVRPAQITIAPAITLSLTIVHPSEKTPTTRPGAVVTVQPQTPTVVVPTPSPVPSNIRQSPNITVTPPEKQPLEPQRDTASRDVYGRGSVR